MTNTTAKQRKLADLYESRGDYHLAALCLEEAIRLYPTPIVGEMAKQDILRLALRLKDCLNLEKTMKMENA